MNDDDDTFPGIPSALLARVATADTKRIPRQTMAEVAAEWQREREDRSIIDAMLHAWLGRTGAPSTEVHRRLCMEALEWGRGLPVNTPLSRARIAAITGGPFEALAALVTEYTRNVGRG